MPRTFVIALVAVVALAAQRPAPAAAAAPVASATFPHAIVVAAEPDAAEAGLKVLRAGGNAIDAAVAVQAVLALEEPQSTSVAGGAFMLFYDARTGRTTAYNGRETAPAAATPDLFVGDDGKPMSFVAAVLSGRSTGVPGAIAMLALAHHEHGRLPWRGLFADAEGLASRGFTVPPRMGAAMNLTFFPQTRTPDAVAYFTRPDGARYRAGDVMRNPALAATLAAIADRGPAALAQGPIAAEILAKVHQGANASSMTAVDLAGYRPEAGPALCRPYRALLFCVPPPPSGGPGVLELLGLLAHSDLAALPAQSPAAWYDFVAASRLAYADRDHYVADPDHVQVPVAGLLDPGYEAVRARLIATDPAPIAGEPPAAPRRGPDSSGEPGGTTHFVIVDAAGNVVSMTTTVESLFGSGRMVDGFFLNNQLTDFSFGASPGPGGVLAANAPDGGKRPRSSMSPVIVLDAHGRFFAAFGSPGGNSIIAYVAKTAMGFVDWKLSLQEAASLPNLVARGPVVAVEKGADPAIAAALAAHGLKVRTAAGENSGIVGATRTRAGYVGAEDPRREAVARGF